MSFQDKFFVSHELKKNNINTVSFDQMLTPNSQNYQDS